MPTLLDQRIYKLCKVCLEINGRNNVLEFYRTSLITFTLAQLQVFCGLKDTYVNLCIYKTDRLPRKRKLNVFFVDFGIFVSMEPFITGFSVTWTLNLLITNSSLCF